MRRTSRTILVPLALLLGARGGAAPAASRVTVPADGAPGASVRRGRALVLRTHDSLPTAAPGGAIRCQSCHLDEGRRAGAAPWTGVARRYPQYRPRSGRVVGLADRVNDCLTRSLAGRALDTAGRDMRDILAYLAWRSRAGAGAAPGPGVPPLALRAADSARGREVFATRCARCHGDGAGTPPAVSALWGPRSYSIGASMARLGVAASFIHRNMPLDAPGSLTEQEAFDVAAFVNAHPRPDLAGKARDWPRGGAPPDVPYPLDAMRPGG